MASLRYLISTLLLDLLWPIVSRCCARAGAERSVALRQLLRRFPWWIRGHLTLGMNELVQIQRATRKPETRALLLIQTSGRAVEKLLEEVPVLFRRRRLKWEAAYLRAAVEFHRKRFNYSLELFTSILALNNSRHLALPTRISALELAAMAALALQDRSTATQFLNQIPEKYRSAETVGLIKALKS